MLININAIKKYKSKIRGIYHIGAHQLEENNYYFDLGVNRVLWFEANPKLVEQFKQNLSYISMQELYNELLSNTDGDEIEFYITNNNASSSMLKLKHHLKYYPHITVSDIIKLKTKKMSTFIREERIDTSKYNFINVDVQGAELKVIEGFEEYLDTIDFIYTEVNNEELYEGCPMMSEIDDFLSHHNFKRIETLMTAANWGDALYART
jgi:FkbM family methyltransferase